MSSHKHIAAHVKIQQDLVVTAGTDGKIQIRSINDQDVTGELLAHDNSIVALDFQYPYILSCGRDETIKIWNVKTQCLVQTLDESFRVLWKAKFYKDNVIAAAKHSGSPSIEVSIFLATERFSLT